MVCFCGYQLKEKLYENRYTLVYRGERIADRRPVVLKILKLEYPSLEDVDRFRHEYQILQHITLEGVIRVYALEKHGNNYTIVMEDIQGKSLNEFPDLPLAEFLRIGIRISEILGELHVIPVIHRDINPANIIWNSQTGQVKLIDFEVAVENAHYYKLGSIDGTLAYISPEQTGRMNCALDYRSDFYSLGVSFYEMLTARLPFSSQDTLELIHCHIAKMPPAPHEVNAKIPRTISNIVMKLMAKRVEDRYQSAFGLRCDLQKCLRELNTTDKVTDFTIGCSDFSHKLQIASKLYGREREINALVTSLERTIHRSQMTLIAGYTGIGKTALVETLQKLLVQRHSYFISGKFEQLKRNIPYAALIQALQSLVQQILMEDRERLDAWREKIRQSLGKNGQVLTNVIPELEWIIGKQPEIVELPPVESQNRLHLVLQNFLCIFATSQHPLVIFFDDLQWSDLSCLQWMRFVFLDPGCKHIFIIGTYRDNEVDMSHPLLIMISELENCGSRVDRILLQPLACHEVNRLVADTLRCGIKKSRRLSRVCWRKTGGNPLFLNQLLYWLYNRGYIRLDTQRGIWTWDMRHICKTDIRQDMIHWLVQKINRLPYETRRVLQLAACIGSQFDLQTLSMAAQLSPQETSLQLCQALYEGLIVPIAPRYKQFQEGEALTFCYRFLHDQVQQTVYSLILDENRDKIHWRIGQLMLNNRKKEHDDPIFNMIQQLNLGRATISRQIERDSLAQWNVRAAQKARASAAFYPAMKYMRTARELLGQDCWEINYALTFSIYRDLAELEYVNGEFANAEDILEITLVKAKSLLEQAEIYCLLITLYTMSAQYDRAILAGKKGLALLQVSLSEGELFLQAEISRLIQILKDRGISSLLDAPEMKDQEKQIAMKLLINLDAPCYYIDQKLFSLVCTKKVSLSLEHGNVPESCGGYYCFGMIVGSSRGDYKMGHELGCLALNLSEKFDIPTQKCRSHNMVANFLMPWVCHIRESDPINIRGYEVGLLSGELEFAGYILGHRLANAFFQGQKLLEIAEKIPEYSHFTQKTKNQIQIDGFWGLQMAIFNMIGKTQGRSSFDVDAFSETEYVESCHRHRTSLALCLYFIFKAQMLYLYGQYRDALACCLEARQQIAYPFGMIATAEHNFYHSLTLAACYEQAHADDQNQYWEAIETNQKQMKIWAESCPQNFEHRYLLVEAEKARLKREYWQAMELYDKAIRSAAENGFVQNQAIANEIAARFYLAHDKEKIARSYMADAIYWYMKWGAISKVKEIEERFSSLIGTIRDAIPQLDKTYDTKVSLNALDLDSVLRALYSISVEIELQKLLHRLMKIIVEISGAQKAFFVVDRNEKLTIEAMYNAQSDEHAVLTGISLEQSSSLDTAIVYYVYRSHRDVILDNASEEGMFTSNNYVLQQKPKSILCIPIQNNKQLIAILYLENNLTSNAFTTRIIRLLKVISSQISISLENALLYESLKREIEERKGIEQALRESEEKYRILYEEAGNPIAIIDVDTLQIVDGNETSRMSSGYNREDIHNMTIFDVDAFHSKEEIHVLVQKILQDGGAVFDTQIRTKNGQILDVIVNVRPIYIQGRRLLLSIYQDITERKKIEAELSNYRKNLEEQVKTRTAELVKINEQLHKEMEEKSHIEQELLKIRKIESLGILAGGIAHDFNNFLTTIMGSISLARREVVGNTVEILTEAEHVCRKAKRLTQQLLTFSKGGAPVKQPMLLGDLIKKSAIFALRGSNVECEFAIESDLWPVELDRSQFEQVMHNLLLNAQQAMPDGGKVTITACNVSTPEKIYNVSTPQKIPLPDGDYVKIFVQDRGIGIAQEHLSKIFDPYFSTKPKGTGLGLATSYSIIQKHGGYIGVESQLKMGSLFYIYLPACRDKEPIDIEEAEKIFKGKGRILLLDDDKNILKSTSKLLQHVGYEVDTTIGGLEAIELYKIAREAQRPYDVLIMDLTIPGGMGGKDAIKQILAIDSTVKAIVSSGYSNDPVMSDFKEYGFSGAILKPYTIAELSDVLNTVMTKEK